MSFPRQTARSTEKLEVRQLQTRGSTVRAWLYEEGEDQGGMSIFNHSPFTPNVAGSRVASGRAAAGEGSAGRPTNDAKSEPEMPTPSSKQQLGAPEKALTLFAMRLAVLEKVASNVGTLGFIWATVVLLGGFAVTLKEIDFWFVTVILVIEGARIFSRSHELEWQHQDAGTEPGNPFSRAYHRSSNALFRSKRLVQSALSNVAPAERTHEMPSPPVNHQHQQQHQNIPSTPVDRQQLHSPVSPFVTFDATRSSFHSHVNFGGGTTTAVPLRRTWSSSRVPLFPFYGKMFQARNISRLFSWMQLLSAMLAIGLSCYRLSTHQYFTRPNEVDTEFNHASALFIFYSLANFEALVFLLERTYWLTQISGRKILVRVNEGCGLPPEDLGTTRRFFYDVYSKCLMESIFEGLKMDMVDYAITGVLSHAPTDQLGGLRVLLSFSKKGAECSEDTLRTVANRQGLVEKLLEMLTWRNAEEQALRKGAADMLNNLVKHNANCVRIAAIPGSIEGVFGLLTQDDEDEYYIRQGGSQPEIRIVGMRILKHLAEDPLNCAKIGNMRGVLSRLVSFVDIHHDVLRSTAEPGAPEDPRILMVRKSLELLNLLAAATGATGKILREEIARVVFTMSNLRKILEHAQSDVILTALAVTMLSSLAMDDVVREIIGRTGGVLRNLVSVFIKERAVGDKVRAKLARKAGEALSLLALQNEENCWRMMRLKVKERGVVVATEEGVGEASMGAGGKDIVAAVTELIEDWDVGDVAMILLRSLCAYTGPGGHKARIANTCTPRALKLAMSRSGRTQEAALGLLAKCEPTPQQIDEFLAQETLSAYDVTARLAGLLKHHELPSTPLPRIRRYCMELAMALAERHPKAFLRELHAHNFRYLLHQVADSTTEVENFATFSGVNGVTPHSLSMAELIESAIKKLQVHHLVSP